ncbi:MAG: hypothetical protein ACE5E4_03850 [Candidatus Binatia bacterium]
MADRFVNLFEPDTLLPAQFFAAFAREGGLVRERRLMLAVLQDAVECYQKYALARDPKGRLLFDDASAWIESPEREWSFSYENICEVLSLNPEYLRKGLSKWRQQRAPIRRNAARIVPLMDRKSGMADAPLAETELKEAS